MCVYVCVCLWPTEQINSRAVRRVILCVRVHVGWRAMTCDRTHTANIWAYYAAVLTTVWQLPHRLCAISWAQEVLDISDCSSSMQTVSANVSFVSIVYRYRIDTSSIDMISIHSTRIIDIHNVLSIKQPKKYKYHRFYQLFYLWCMTAYRISIILYVTSIEQQIHTASKSYKRNRLSQSFWISSLRPSNAYALNTAYLFVVEETSLATCCTIYRLNCSQAWMRHCQL